MDELHAEDMTVFMLAFSVTDCPVDDVPFAHEDVWTVEASVERAA